MHSRRKRERRWEEFRDLRITVKELKRTNAHDKKLHSELLSRLDQAKALVSQLETNKTLLPQLPEHPTLPGQAPFTSDDPLQVVPGGSSQDSLLESQMTDFAYGCNRESSESLEERDGSDIMPLLELTLVLPRYEVEFPDATWQLTYPGTVPADFTIMDSPPEPPYCFPPNGSILLLPLEEPSFTGNPALASTLPPLSQGQLFEGVPHRFNARNSHHGSPTCALPSSIHGWNASTDHAWVTDRSRQSAGIDDFSSSFLTAFERILTAFERTTPAAPAAPAPLLVVLGVERVVDSSQSRRGRADDDSAETLFDGILDSWGCLI